MNIETVKVKVLNNGGYRGLEDFDFETIVTGHLCSQESNALTVDRQEFKKGGGYIAEELAILIIDNECQLVG